MVHGLPGSKRMKLSLIMWLDEDLTVPSTVMYGVRPLGNRWRLGSHYDIDQFWVDPNLKSKISPA